MKARAIMAGIMIGFAAILSCAISNPILAAGFFSLGLLYIRMNGWYLYTGQIQNLALKKTTYFGTFEALSFVRAKSMLYLFATRSKDLILSSVISMFVSP